MKKHYNIEFLRFVFSVLIVYFHILNSNIIPYVGENGVYLNLQQMCKFSSAVVECFLVMSGYFIFTSCRKSPVKSVICYALGRFFRLWPVFAFYTVFTMLLLGAPLTEDTLLDLAFLRCTGISLAYKGIIWYVAPFFWCSLLIYAILTLCKKPTAGIILTLVCYFSYVINLNYRNGSLGREVIWNFLSLGMLRVMAGLCLGVLIGMVLAELSAAYKPLSDAHRRICLYVFSALEAICCVLLFLIFLSRKIQIRNVFTIVIIFSILFVCFLKNAGIISRMLNKPWFGFFGKYTFSVYVMQQASFYILGRTFWKNTGFVCTYEIATILISLVFSVILGIGTYYLVEKPVYSRFLKWERNHGKITADVEQSVPVSFENPK